MRLAVRQVRPPGSRGLEHLVRRKVDSDEPRPSALCGRSVDSTWLRHIGGWIDLSTALVRSGWGSCQRCESTGRALASAEATRAAADPPPRPTTAIGRLLAMVERYREIVGGGRPDAEDWARQLDLEAATVLAETTLDPLPDQQPESPR